MLRSCCDCSRRRVGEGEGGRAVELEVAVTRMHDGGESWRSNEVNRDTQGRARSQESR